MQQKRIVEKARKNVRVAKSPSTAAGPFVRKEIQHARAGKHGTHSRRQAIAIGLNEARQAGVPVKPAPKATTTSRSRAGHEERGLHEPKRHRESHTPRTRTRGRTLKRDPKSTRTGAALPRQAHKVVRRRRKAS